MKELPDFTDIKVLVVGDVMLDRYWHGGTNRISPEAPVPVVHVTQEEGRPGGAVTLAKRARGFSRQSCRLIDQRVIPFGKRGRECLHGCGVQGPEGLARAGTRGAREPVPTR